MLHQYYLRPGNVMALFHEKFLALFLLNAGMLTMNQSINVSVIIYFSFLHSTRFVEAAIKCWQYRAINMRNFSQVAPAPAAVRDDHKCPEGISTELIWIFIRGGGTYLNIYAQFIVVILDHYATLQLWNCATCRSRHGVFLCSCSRNINHYIFSAHY